MVVIDALSFIKRTPLILVADDDSLIRNVVRKILEPDQYEIIETSNGAQTIAEWKYRQPDLILLDIILPDINGCAVCARIREMASGKKIPIMMLTSKEDDETINNAFKVGADDYILKNFNHTVLRNRIRRLLEAEENRKMLERLSKLERINVLGKMIASIGHEVRNPLTTVRGFLQFLNKKQELTRYAEYFTLMVEEVDRADLIIKEFLALAKDKAMNFKLVRMHDFVGKMLPILKQDAVLYNVRLEVQLMEVPAVWIDQESLQQMIGNLMRNALEAMPDGGVVKISTCVQKQKVLFSIEDEGIGIPGEIMEKLGTPFISSKENGTGLGLAICYRLAQRHDAEIMVKSEKDKGTAFTVSFPIPAGV